MIVVYCFHPGDQELALKNARWWNQLGGCKGHEVLAGYDPRCNQETVELIRQELIKAFDKVYKVNVTGAVDGWPEGANHFFGLCTTYLQSHPEWPYFFWMEPDAIPLREGWLDAIVEAHRKSGKPFMGDRVEVEDIPLHMSGIGIYQNPIYKLAGECYRAHDTAWDMAAAHQIVPNAAFTDLIEHAWKHPSFLSYEEIKTQIAPQTILFHSSKDGSLIDLLRGGKQLASASIHTVLPTEKEREEPRSPSPLPIYDILIRTYPGDYEWLNYCLKSIDKYVTGFRKIWIISPADPKLPLPINHPAEWKVMNDETEDGYLAQQITKLYADVITDYQPDYILHVDSDVIFTRPTTPRDFFQKPCFDDPWGAKLIWYYTPYSEIQTPWQPITEKFMSCKVGSEYMRRLPMMVPRWLYPKLREFCHKQHGMVISDYIKMQSPRAFSEFNALGAFASLKHDREFSWVNTTIDPMPEPFAKQFHSWSGLTPAVKDEIETILRSGGKLASDGDGSRAEPQAPSGTPLPQTIKILPSGVWVLEGDQISQWVEQEGRLDHDQNLLPDILKHIKPGSTVVDAGAFIGDHTLAYSLAVGPAGRVYAFEPNPYAYRCLKHNLREHSNVTPFFIGLSDKSEVVPLSGNNGNWGGAYVGEHKPITTVKLVALETEIPWGADFIKIDVEGYELKVLRGAGNLINRYRPVMVIEMNREALQRQGTNASEIYDWLRQHGYDWTIMQKNCFLESPLYDILCLPVAQSPEVAQPQGSSARGFVVPTAPPPVTLPQEESLLSPKEKMVIYVSWLKEFSEKNVHNRMLVMQRLSYAGLKTKKYKRKTPR